MPTMCLVKSTTPLPCADMSLWVVLAAAAVVAQQRNPIPQVEAQGHL